jgi:hypothetical protein
MIWLMNGTNAVSVGAAGSFNPGPSWQVKGTGDFNGDGKSDILWQGKDGTAAVWLMDGTTATSVGMVGTNPGPTWEIKGTGDFNGDGKSDILWQGQNGTPAIWLMDGTNVVSVHAAGSFNPGTDWHVIIYARPIRTRDLPESGTLSRPKSDTSDFGWGLEVGGRGIGPRSAA